MPHVVTPVDEEVDYKDFSIPPTLLHSPLPHPPTVEERLPSVTREELRCLQALGRMKKGNEDEIAPLAGISNDTTKDILESLEQRKLVAYKRSPSIKHGKTKAAQIDLFSSWHPTLEGLSVALRSWSVPKGTQFTARLEKNLSQIGNGHR